MDQQSYIERRGKWWTVCWTPYITHASRAECKVFMFWIVDQGAMAGKDSQGLSALMLGVDSGQGEVASGKGC